ncbi:Uncharacterised protein [Mycoplasmopsis columboralis]|uniref:Transglutaminase-like domain-containing protein n=1 Tax=Mycoplasmopsis columboralis TaxID=171282 RepID=A0A449B5Q8_9BACT|nr:hypothetical protein [Mycoplasmopsis columboralis]VEU75858.1 Uncharacterised protein [Mycoplasmopsis columboralis]
MKLYALRKLLFITPLSISPLITFSCSTNQEIKKEEPIKEDKLSLELTEKYSIIYDKIIKELPSKRSDLVNLKSDVNDFYINNYEKLLNKDLKAYYLKFKSEIIKTIDKKIQLIDSVMNTSKNTFVNFFVENKIYDTFVKNARLYLNTNKWKINTTFVADFPIWEKMVNLEKEIFYEKYKEVNDNLLPAVNSFKEDAWMVFDVKDKVNLDFLNSKWDFRQNYKTKEQKNKAKSEWDFVFLKLRTLANDSEELVYEKEDKNPSKTQELYEKYFTLVRDIVPTIVSKKWDFDKQVKALTKYLVVKNFYNFGEKEINKVYLTLENEESIFNCQAYSEFMFLSLNALGHKNNIQFNGWYYLPNGKWLPHVNLNYDNNGKVYVIDATFSDQFNTKNPTLNDYNKVNADINRNILIPIEEYQARLNAVPEFLGY